MDPSTASRVLNHDATLVVKDETRKRILDAVKKLHYVPNAMARGLRTRQSQTVALIVPNIANPYFPEIILGAERVLAERGYNLILADTDVTPDREIRLVESLVSRLVDGFILATAFTEDETVDRLIRDGVPFVLVNRSHRSIPNYVVANDREATQESVLYLAGLGHRRIGHITGPLYTETGLDRLAGYREGLLRAGFDFDGALTAEGDFKEASGFEAMKRLWAAPEKPTAVVVGNDLMAVGALQAARDLGIRVPEDLSIIGFDDIPLCRYITPTLTTMRVPVTEMGEEAAHLLLAIMEGAEDGGGSRVLPTQLVVRDSTAPLSQV